MGRLQNLEGLRGYAALIVVLSHCVMAFWPGLHNSRFSTPTPFERIILETPLPFFYNGTIAVYIFFTLSGYVLSASFFKNNDNNFIQKLFLRRYVRLVIPITASCILFYGLWKAGAIITYTEPNLKWMAKWYSPNAQYTLIDSIKNGLTDSILLGSGIYNVVLWTMKIEFWGSLLVFCNCLLLKGIDKKTFFYFTQSVLLYYLIGESSYYYICFFVGMYMAENGSKSYGLKTGAFAAIIAVTLGSLHNQTIIHQLINIPIGVSYIISSAIFLSLAIGYKPFIIFLSNRSAIFLGKISFSLYLTHMATLVTIGVWSFSNIKNYLSYNTSAIFSSFLVITLSITIAYIFTYIDIFSMKASKLFSSLFLK